MRTKVPFASPAWARRFSCIALAGASLLSMTIMSCSTNKQGLDLEWKQLPPLPDPVGVAGAFAGISGNALIVAGGANFPDKMPWEGGTKAWHDEVFVLEKIEGPWKRGFRLPFPNGYGVSLTVPEGVVCIGGGDAKQHFTNVFLLRWEQGQLTTRDLAPLPLPLANGCGAVLDQSLYVAGGTDSPEATRALKVFLRLDLSSPGARWEELPAWPGPARMLAVATSTAGSLFLAGGTDLGPGSDGKPVRTYLKDSYRFTPGQGWTRSADMPNPVVAAPSPAPNLRSSSFVVIGGDDGSLAGFEPRSKHPGFPRRVLHYDVRNNSWQVGAEAPVSRATLPTAAWHGWHIIPSGEARPGIRSPEVWACRSHQR